ncbi:MAG: pyrroline-5-carboxylate reductase [Alphaproteobacteria bacterium]|nr:pyrroline-5-carboxylate reductase [Alphaproteobacteria bacterium]
MTSALPAISLIGCGKMGGALLRGWISKGLADRFLILDPHSLPPEFAQIPAVTAFTRLEDYLPRQKEAAVIVLAVKPQIMDDVCAALAPSITPETLVLSIAAGRTIVGFERHFGVSQPVIRAMPNTPASIGRGMTVMTSNAAVREDQRVQAEDLLQATGRLAWLADEALMDAVTAVSGSGPAYVFLLMETLAAAGEKLGLDPALAGVLARETVTGAAALADQDTDLSAATLRQNVTSPGGTTEAALSVLMDGTLQSLFDRALSAARDRGKALGQ